MAVKHCVRTLMVALLVCGGAACGSDDGAVGGWPPTAAGAGRTRARCRIRLRVRGHTYGPGGATRTVG